MESLKLGSRVIFYDKESELYISGIIINSEKDVNIKTDDGKIYNVSANELQQANPLEQDSLDDISKLWHNNGAAVTSHLLQRYRKNICYTFVGPVLISINPYKPIDNSAIDNITRSALEDLDLNKKNQTIIVTGESGAGKTETTKIILKSIIENSNRNNIADKLMASTIILESFGNARTQKNDNSSRFGKFINIYIEKKIIKGAEVKSYLLEKTRVIKQQIGERNYHIFYQICCAPDILKKYGIDTSIILSPAKYNYLNPEYMIKVPVQKNRKYIRTVSLNNISNNLEALLRKSDHKEFVETLESLSIFGVDRDDINTLLSILLGIMFLGNIEFVEDIEGELRVKYEGSINEASKCLNIPKNILYDMMTKKKIIIRDSGETFISDLSINCAIEQRDAIAMYIYDCLFNWILTVINTDLRGELQKTSTSINILDIYGFERFEENSFEQLCINYANERLQQQFTQLIIRNEQDEYISENIGWQEINIGNIRTCIDAIERQSTGIFYLLDEESRLEYSNFQTLANKIVNYHKKSLFVSCSRDKLTLTHYAGNVTYNLSTNFIEKNRYYISVDIKMLKNGSNIMEDMVSIAPIGNMSISLKFKQDLDDIMKYVGETNIHYIRCIKPNDERLSNKFVCLRVLDQLLSNGIIDAISIIRYGFPIKMDKILFFSRYYIIVNGDNNLSVFASKHNIEIKIGKTKFFMRQEGFNKLEIERASAINSLTKLQAIIRGRNIRSIYRAKLIIIRFIQENWRLLYAKIEYEKIKASTKINSYIRTYNAIKSYFILEKRSKPHNMHLAINESIVVTRTVSQKSNNLALQSPRRSLSEKFIGIPGLKRRVSNNNVNIYSLPNFDTEIRIGKDIDDTLDKLVNEGSSDMVRRLQLFIISTILAMNDKNIPESAIIILRYLINNKNIITEDMIIYGILAPLDKLIESNKKIRLLLSYFNLFSILHHVLWKIYVNEIDRKLLFKLEWRGNTKYNMEIWDKYIPWYFVRNRSRPNFLNKLEHMLITVYSHLLRHFIIETYEIIEQRIGYCLSLLGVNVRYYTSDRIVSGIILYNELEHIIVVMSKIGIKVNIISCVIQTILDVIDRQLFNEIFTITDLHNTEIILQIKMFIQEFVDSIKTILTTIIYKKEEVFINTYELLNLILVDRNKISDNLDTSNLNSNQKKKFISLYCTIQNIDDFFKNGLLNKIKKDYYKKEIIFNTTLFEIDLANLEVITTEEVKKSELSRNLLIEISSNIRHMKKIE